MDSGRKESKQDPLRPSLIQKLSGFSLQHLLRVPKGRFKQVLIGKEGQKEKEQSRSNSAAVAQYWFLLKEHI